VKQSNRSGPAATGLISLQEALRTLGLGLEVAKVLRAEIVIGNTGIDIDTPSEYGHRAYAWSDLDSQSRAQQRHRRSIPRSAPWMDPAALTRWSVLLRVIGQLLDAQGIRECTMQVSVASPDDPQECRVTVKTNGKVVVDNEQVQLQLLRLRTRYVDARAADPPAARRPWWAVWRRD
jgi:hypothetical protein